MSTKRTRPKPQKSETSSRAAAADQTRQALIEAGLELFRENGLDAPSLDLICERAGYTRGAFYVHFDDRDAFIDAVMEHIGLPLLDAVLGDPGSEPDDLDTTATRFLGAVASGAYPLTSKKGPRPHQLLDACARSERVRKRYVELIRESVARLSGIVRRSQSGGSVRADVDADAIAWIALAAIVGGQTLLELRAFSDLAGPAAGFLGLVRGPELAGAGGVSSVTAQDLLEAYVEQHNCLVEKGGRARLAGLGALFHDDAVLRFKGIPFGPVDGRAAIERAFVNQPPSAAISLVSTTPGANADQAFGTYLDDEAGPGVLELSSRAGRITQLVIGATRGRRRA